MRYTGRKIERKMRRKHKRERPREKTKIHIERYTGRK